MGPIQKSEGPTRTDSEPAKRLGESIPVTRKAYFSPEMERSTKKNIRKASLWREGKDSLPLQRLCSPASETEAPQCFLGLTAP